MSFIHQYLVVKIVGLRKRLKLISVCIVEQKKSLISSIRVDEESEEESEEETEESEGETSSEEEDALRKLQKLYLKVL